MATSSQVNIVDVLSPELRNCLTPEQVEQLSQPPNNPEVLSTEYKIALEFSEKGNNKAAKELHDNLAARQKVLGTSHADALATMHYLGLVQINLGNYTDAEATYRELVPLHEKPAASLGARSNLGHVLDKVGKYSEAEQVLRGLLPDLKERCVEDDQKVLGCLRHLMEAVGGQGRVDEALTMNEEGMGLVAKMTGEHQVAELEVMKEMRAQLEEWKSKA